METIQIINALLWHDYVLYAVLVSGVLFTCWSMFSQYRALTHGVRVTLGHYDNPDDPGAINHFQALSTAMSSTVGLGNIGGVALAISLGGPGALFWMWIVGAVGMALKVVEVTLSMLYRNTDDPDNPHGGPMWVARKGFAEWGWPRLGLIVGGVYCVATVIGSFTGGNMFQAWNVADASHTYFGMSKPLVGIILAVIVGTVLIGGIRRIGQVTGVLVPVMCAAYLAGGIYVLVLQAGQIPDMLSLIVRSAFNGVEATGAFVGGSVGAAMLWGMKRALYSSEAGLGASAIAHAAAKTDEPAREGLVAGLEPFIDTLVVCTITGLVIITAGVWNRPADAGFAVSPTFVETPSIEAETLNEAVPLLPVYWHLEELQLPAKLDGEAWTEDTDVFVIVVLEPGREIKLSGTINLDTGITTVTFPPVLAKTLPTLRDSGVYQTYAGASLTALAFNQTHAWLGGWLVTIAAWLFAVSTIIAQGYYAEQALVYLFRGRGILQFKLLYCLATFVATLGFIRTARELDAITTTGTGLVLLTGLPITLIFGYKAIGAYHNYIARLKAGTMIPEHRKVHLVDVVSGKDVER